MLTILAERLRQRYRTVPYPAKEPVLSPLFTGKPVLQNVPAEALQPAMDICPTGAVFYCNDAPALDMGRCIFCGQCAAASPGAIAFSKEHRLAGLARKDLIITPENTVAGNAMPDEAGPGDENDKNADGNTDSITPDSIRNLFKRSFRIREVSAAGCNACEADCNVLTTVVFDLARFGIDFVASPRHADAVLVTGPLPRNMHSALRKCYNAMPGPKVVIAVGACAISGGLFNGMNQDARGVMPHLPVDVFIPGCPPNPYTILHGLLRFLKRV